MLSFYKNSSIVGLETANNLRESNILRNDVKRLKQY